MAFGRSASAKLKEIADEFVDLEENTKRYLIKGGAKDEISLTWRVATTFKVETGYIFYANKNIRN